MQELPVYRFGVVNGRVYSLYALSYDSDINIFYPGYLTPKHAAVMFEDYDQALAYAQSNLYSTVFNDGGL